MSLDHLKTEARQLGITDSDVEALGNVRHMATWRKAISQRKQHLSDRYMKKLAAEAAERDRQSKQSPGDQSSIVFIAPVVAASIIGNLLFGKKRKAQ